jgi:hypothetical protein
MIDPSQTGASLTLSQQGTSVFQRTISATHWTVIKPGKIYVFEDETGLLAGGITRAKLTQSPRGVTLKIAADGVDLSALAAGNVELRYDFGAETVASPITCEAKPSTNHVTLKCGN